MLQHQKKKEKNPKTMRLIMDHNLQYDIIFQNA